MAKFIKYTIGISITIVIGLLVAYLVVFMNNGQSTFYVQYGETEIRNKAENIELPTNELLIFECKNSFGMGNSDYTVKIVFSEKFTIKMDDGDYQINATVNITDNFNLVKNNEFFTLYIPDNLTLIGILQNYYPDKVISEVPTIDLTAKSFFAIVASSTSNEKDIIQISFRLGG